MATKKKDSVSNDIKDVALELAMLSADPTVEIKKSTPVKAAAKPAAKAAPKPAAAKAAASTAAKKATEAAKKVAAKATTAASKATESAKKAVASATASKAPKRTIVVEYAGNQYMVEDIIARCEAKFKAESKKKAFSDIKIYIKPENNAAYYVVDEKSADKIDLI